MKVKTQGGKAPLLRRPDFPFKVQLNFKRC